LPPHLDESWKENAEARKYSQRVYIKSPPSHYWQYNNPDIPGLPNSVTFLGQIS
jgi:hypothetical protein